MSGNNKELPPEVVKRMRELHALIRHYINPTKKSKAAFDEVYGQLAADHMMELMVELMGLEDRQPGDWEGLQEQHEENLSKIMQEADTHELRAALKTYIDRLSTADDVLKTMPHAKELIEKIQRERQSYISKMIADSQEGEDDSESDGEDDPNDSEMDEGDSDDSEDGDPQDSDDDGDDGSDDDQDGDDSDSEPSEDSDQNGQDSDSEAQDQSDSSDQNSDKSDKDSQDQPKDQNQDSQDQSDGDADDSNPEDGESEELDPESFADDMADDADDGDSDGDDDGEEDGDGDGEDGDDGDDGDGDGSDGEDGEQDGDGQGEDGEDGRDDGYSYGFEQPEDPPPGTYQISDEEPDPIAVSKLLQSLQALIARDPEEPTQAPRWNVEKLVKLMLEPGSDLTRAKEPTQIPQDIVFIFDNSGSMNEFEKAARRLAQAVGTAGDLGSTHVVSIVTSNGQYSKSHSAADFMHGKNPFAPKMLNNSARQDDSGGWYINGEYQGVLPYDPATFTNEDHCARWEWFLKKELPRKHNITPKVVLYFSDEHGSIQWCYMSHRLKEMEHIWLDPNAREFPDGSKPNRATKWPRGEFPKNMEGMTNDGLYNKSEGYVDLFRKFKGVYLSSVGQDTSNEYSMEDDVCKALKQVAGL